MFIREIKVYLSLQKKKSHNMLKRVTCIYFYCKKRIFTSISTYPQESLKIHFESEINQIFRFLLGVVKDLSVLCKKKKKWKKSCYILARGDDIPSFWGQDTFFFYLYIYNQSKNAFKKIESWLCMLQEKSTCRSHIFKKIFLNGIEKGLFHISCAFGYFQM